MKKEESQFNYQAYKQEVIDTETLKELMNLILEPKTKFGAILAGSKLLLACVFLIAMKIKMEQEEKITKQKYQRDESSHTDDIVNDRDF